MSKGYFSKEAAANPDRRSGVVAELNMVSLKKIPTRRCESEVAACLPFDSGITCPIGGHFNSGKRADVASLQVRVHRCWKVECTSENALVGWARAFHDLGSSDVL